MLEGTTVELAEVSVGAINDNRFAFDYHFSDLADTAVCKLPG